MIDVELIQKYEIALKKIAEWSLELQDEIEENNAGIAMWRGCVAVADIALGE